MDSKVIAVGSQNWSGDGVLRNRDASLIIWHDGAAQYFEQLFDYDWDNLAKQKLTAEVSTKDSMRPGPRKSLRTRALLEESTKVHFSQ